MYHWAASIMRIEECESRGPGSFTIESLGDIVTGESPAATRIFDIMTGLLLSKTKGG